MTTHKKHTTQLEKALRCLDNDAICSEDIDPLKEELEYYLVRMAWGFVCCFLIYSFQHCMSTAFHVCSLGCFNPVPNLKDGSLGKGWV